MLILRLGKSATDPIIDVYHDILMNGKYIANMHDTGSSQDAATKTYVDNLTNKFLFWIHSNFRGKCK